MFKNEQEMKAYVKKVLTEKNIQKIPRTLDSRMNDYHNAEFFGLIEKRDKFGVAIKKFCESLSARDYANLPESVKSELLTDEALKAKALIQARKVRELAELRIRLQEKEADVEQSAGKIPFAQREQFQGLLVELQNVVATEAE